MLFLMLWQSSISWAFVPKSFEMRSRPRGSFLICAVEPSVLGLKLYDASYAGKVETLKTVLAECKGK